MCWKPGTIRTGPSAYLAAALGSEKDDNRQLHHVQDDRGGSFGGGARKKRNPSERLPRASTEHRVADIGRCGGYAFVVKASLQAFDVDLVCGSDLLLDNPVQDRADDRGEWEVPTKIVAPR